MGANCVSVGRASSDRVFLFLRLLFLKSKKGLRSKAPAAGGAASRARAAAASALTSRSTSAALQRRRRRRTDIAQRRPCKAWWRGRRCAEERLVCVCVCGPARDGLDLTFPSLLARRPGLASARRSPLTATLKTTATAPLTGRRTPRAGPPSRAWATRLCSRGSATPRARWAAAPAGAAALAADPRAAARPCPAWPTCRRCSCVCV